MRRRAWLSLAALALTPAAHAAAPPPPAGPPVEFNRDVRPILSDACFTCHGPDKGKRKADLRLDTEEGAFAALGEHKALVPGKPEHSAVYLRMTDKDPRKRMPPAKSGKPLTAQQIDVVRRWIAQGAKWEKHWALIPPARPAPPAVTTKGWHRNALDAFVLARLEKERLKPAPEADRRALIRRLSFDLLGLPPTPKEVDAFLADKRPDAYEKLVDRLLGSEHYGERMALFWLDAVRFADTGGYHSDNHRDIYLYRDYVIRAFNSNKRFDVFTAEQLAGDLLPDPTPEQKIASGYNRLLMTTEEGGAQAKEYLAKYSADRVRNASGVWLGLTLGCAECHTHKFDPVTIKEFYQFAAFFADVTEVPVGRQPQVKVPSLEQSLRLKTLDQKIKEAEKLLSTTTPALAKAQAKWEEATRARLDTLRSDWTAVKPTKAASARGERGATLTVQDDLSVLSSGVNADKDTYVVTLKTDQKDITAIRLEALTHPGFGNKSLSRANGNFVLTGFTVQLAAPGGKPLAVPIARALADYSQPGFPVESLVGGKGGKGWAVEGHVRQSDRTAVFVFSKPIAGGPGTTLTVRMAHASGFAGHNVGRFRLSLTSAEKPGLGDKGGLPEPVVQALKAEPEKRTPAQKEALARHYRGVAPELNPARRELAELQAQKADVERKMPTTLISVARMPRPIRVLPRGNWLDDSGEVVAPGVPAALPALKVTGRRATRLDLARWLTRADHPLTARVFVNRLWKLFYGQGLVTSLDDFGSQGAWPSHPELLDWLALEFVESGWDVKHLVKLMVTSATYRQTSKADAALRARDPYNRLLARQARFRHDAEVVRDNALAVSGLLTRVTGGPSVKPYQPAGYWSYLNFPKRDYVADAGENQYRRGLYTYVQRTFPHPSLVAFDAPSREECTVDRPRSNTPLQALVLLNDPTYVEAARALAQRVLEEGGKDEARLTFAYRTVLGRPPRAEEAKVLLALLGSHAKQYQADPKAADELLSTGLHPVPKDMNKADLAAWTSVARVLLNLHETITRE